MTKGGSAAVVRRHPAWLNDDSSDIRWAAIECLAEKGGAQDLPALRRALSDRNETVRLAALRGIVRLKPSDTRTLLQRFIHNHPEEVEAHTALADLGDEGQLRLCVSLLSRFADAWRRDHSNLFARVNGVAVDAYNLKSIAKVIVAHRAPGAAAALTKISALPSGPYNSASQFQAAGFGGLAALGDPTAIIRVRQLTADSDMFAAANAIEWLGISKDRPSIPLLRDLLQNREITVREAAAKALTAMGTQAVEPSVVPHLTKTSTHQASPQRLWLLPAALGAAGLIISAVIRATSRKA